MRIASQKIKGLKNWGDMLTDPGCLVAGEELSLECWTCMRCKKLNDIPYRYGKKFVMSEAAKSVGWIAATDFRRQRVLAFCSERCELAARTKDGLFKARRPKP